MIYDCDGSLTGTPNTYVTNDTELVTPATGFTYDPSWDANIVPGPYTAPYFFLFGQLELENWDPNVTFDRLHLFSVDRGTGRDVYEPMADLGKYPISLLLNEEYEITFPTAATRNFDLELRFATPNAYAVLGIEYANPGPSSVTVNGIAVGPAPDLQSLKNGNGNAYFYDPANDRLYLKPVLGGTGGLIIDGTQVDIEVRE